MEKFRIRNYINTKLGFMIAGILVVGFIYNSCVSMVPVYIQKVIDLGIDADRSEFYQILAGFALIQLLKVFIGFSDMALSWYFDSCYNKTLKKKIVAAVMKRSNVISEDKGDTEYLSVLENDAAVTHDYFENLISLLKYILAFSIYVFTMLRYISLKSILMISILFFIIILLSNRFESSIKCLFEDYSKQRGIYLGRLKTFLRGYRLFSAETYSNFSAAHDGQSALLERAKLKYNKKSAQAKFVTKTGNYMIHFVMIIGLAVLMYRGLISLGSGIALFQLLNYAFELAGAVIAQYCVLVTLHGGFVRIDELLNKCPPKVSLRSDIDEISLRNAKIAFAKPIIEDADLVIQKGRNYLLTGANGCGKSTLLKAMLGMIPFAKGECLYNGISNQRVNPLDDIEYLTENPSIYNTGYINNITCFGSYSIDDKIIDGLDRCILDEIKLIQNADDCRQLSKGQQQLVGLIRFLMSGKKVLIADEGFSAVDQQKLNGICRYLLRRKDITFILVAHHLEDELAKTFDYRISVENKHVVMEKSNG